VAGCLGRSGGLIRRVLSHHSPNEGARSPGQARRWCLIVQYAAAAPPGLLLWVQNISCQPAAALAAGCCALFQHPYQHARIGSTRIAGRSVQPYCPRQITRSLTSTPFEHFCNGPSGSVNGAAPVEI
jgi:hypothetical protein